MKTYTVIMVGPPAAGKTVLLASMHKRLSVMRDNTKFFIEAEPEQRKLLNQKYLEIAGAGEWPEGTQFQEISQWKFTVRVETEDLRKFSALQFIYLDYAGGRLTSASQSNLIGSELYTDFDTKVREADSLLGLLDGRKILSLMLGESSAQNFLLEHISTIVQLLQQSEQPTHFVISKWDLLDGRFTLGQIRDRLMEDDDFRSLVNQRSKKCTMRLIPVSAVGFGFAELMPDGEMRKISGVAPKPFQVEMPIACILPDKLKAELNALKEQELKIRNQSLNGSENLSIWDVFAKNFGVILKTIHSKLPEKYRFDDALMKAIIDFLEYNARSKEEEASIRKEALLRKQDEALKLVKDEVTAVNSAVSSFLCLVDQLERDFPDSILSNHNS